MKGFQGNKLKEVFMKKIIIFENYAFQSGNPLKSLGDKKYVSLQRLIVKISS